MITAILGIILICGAILWLCYWLAKGIFGEDKFWED
jgi:hypothetical protein